MDLSTSSVPSTSTAPSLGGAKLSFSFKSKAKTQPPPPPAAQSNAFGDDEDSKPSTSTLSNDKKGTKGRKDVKNDPRGLVPQQAGLTKAQRREIEQQKKVDATVYEYDAVYESLKEAERKEQERREEEAKVRQPKYIGNLLQSTAQRKRDHLIAEEKMIAREREAEGDEFADKEKFVTQAYKDQMEANRKAEEEERKREELEKKSKKAGPGMTAFYASLLQKSDEKHNAILEASKTKGVIGPTMPPPESLAIRPPTKDNDGDVEMTDGEIARRARQEGKDVELNDEGQIIDKRQLLSAGLNLQAKNTRDLGQYKKDKSLNPDDPPDPSVYHRAVGVAASKREIDQRRRREIEKQIEEEERRKVEDTRRKEEEERNRAVKRKNDDDAVMSAKERYMERKRRKLEEEKEKKDEDES